MYINIGVVKGVIMLYFSLIDILFLLVGVCIGVALTVCVSSSGYEHKCDNCVYREIVEMDGGDYE